MGRDSRQIMRAYLDETLASRHKHMREWHKVDSVDDVYETTTQNY